MRTLVLAAAAALTLAPAAVAAPLPAVSSVSVTIGPELQEKAAETYGVRDIQRLADELQRDVERELARKGALGDGGRLDLVLVDAKPNRPTFKQLSDTPGLSFQSFGVGGATIEGRAVAADGTVTPLRYRWYETDIRQAARGGVWSDAEWTINRFASRLSRGEAVAQR
jgi:hypothetical protein